MMSQLQSLPAFSQSDKTLLAGGAGMLVGAGEIILLPLDILKVKLQTGIKDPAAQKTFMDVWRTENPYKGVTVTALRNMKGSFSFFAVREELKKDKYRENYHITAGMANAAATAASISIAVPYDVIKTRMQADSRALKPREVLADTIKNEGFSALTKGGFAKLATQGPKLWVWVMVAEKIEKGMPEHIASASRLANQAGKTVTEAGTQASSLVKRLFNPAPPAKPPVVQEAPKKSGPKLG